MTEWVLCIVDTLDLTYASLELILLALDDSRLGSFFF